MSLPSPTLPTPDRATHPLSAGVCPIVLQAGALTLSALVARPATPPRATVVALHGGGMSAGYFDGQAHPDLSLLVLGARLGYTVVAVDRPGYGLSAADLPRGQALSEQATTLRTALVHLGRRYDTGAGVFLLGHSFGGMLALTYAASDEASPSRLELLGLDVSGVGRDYITPPDAVADPLGQRTTQRHWGPLRCYPPDTFREAKVMVAPLPERERAEAARWPQRFTATTGRVRVPARMTFAEHERWWRHGDEDIAGLPAQFTAAPSFEVGRQPGSGHNVSLGWTARTYHLRAFAFFDECLARRTTTASAVTAR
ncbi:alpha/beta fold hydrolase [Streptomyces sp. NPDC048420]|uniref:alpha/beta hydrolase n=1 Tax=Streptomyces sp. NPDC048420 TaxID=3155755 RepID=UPI003421D96B